MHKPAQVELQLDRPQLPYSETQGPIIAGGSPAHYRRRQPNPTRKGPHKPKPNYIYIYIYLYINHQTESIKKFLGVCSERKSPTNIKQKVSASRNFLEFVGEKRVQSRNFLEFVMKKSPTNVKQKVSVSRNFLEFVGLFFSL